jgi:uncharacterized protein
MLKGGWLHMQYRHFDRWGFDTSIFGIGCMRLPVIKSEDGKEQIDEKQAIEMIRYGIDHGVNYIDTAYPYHDGQSEPVVGKALKDGYREKIKLATKLPVWQTKKYEDFEKILDEQLQKLDVDYIDFYLLHSLSKSTWEKVKKLGVLDFLDDMVKKGKIKHPAFSFHDEFDVFKDIIDSYDWHMCQIQLNILDENNQAGVKGLKYAGSKNIPVVIMEPLRGGKLANVPQDVSQIWNKYSMKRSPVEWAFRWVYNFPEVAVILSGVSNMEQLKDNLEIFHHATPNSMTPEEQKLVHEVQMLYNSKIKVRCTNCRYCMPCPSRVSIPYIFSLYNDASMYDDFPAYKDEYKKLIEKGKDASNCVQCGNCESVCPQSISIIDHLKEADEQFKRVL